MMRLLFFILLFLSCITVPAQDAQFEWVRGIGGSSNDLSYVVATDATGNSFSAGGFMGTVDMDRGPAVYNLTAEGPMDIFITKYDPSGNLLWARRVGNDNPLNEGIRALGVDAAGNVYISGSIQGTVDFDPGPGVSSIGNAMFGAYIAFLLKLDINGNFVWVRDIAHTAFSSEGYSLDAAASGNIFVTGRFQGLTDFDPGPGIDNGNSAAASHGVFISKLDNDGNYLWSKQFISESTGMSYSIKADAFDNVYTTGIFGTTVDFDPNAPVFNLTTNLSGYDVFISKLDVNGNFVWAKQIEGAYYETAFGLSLDSFGNLYLTGTFDDLTDFDPGPATFFMTANYDVASFLLKLTTDGNFVWAKKFGSVSNTIRSQSVVCDAAGDVYLAGNFVYSIDFDPGSADYTLTTFGDLESIFISKYKADGSFVFAKHIGTSANFTIAYDIALDAFNNIFVSGFFADAPDFDPGPGTHIMPSEGQADGYVLKLRQCLQATSDTITTTACNAYTLNNQTYTTSGVYTQHLINVSGCDSAIILQLTLGGSISNDTITSCDSYLWEGQTYTSSGNYSATYIGADGCDSIRKLNLIIKNSVTSAIDISLCDGASYAGYNVSGVYTDLFTSANGCDSTRILNLTIKPAAQSIFNVAICEGESYWGHSVSNTYYDTLVSVSGCDSVRMLRLTVNSTKHINTSVVLCAGETYFASGADQTSSGIYTDTLTTYLGCDSIIITAITVHPLPVPVLGADRDLCAGSTLQLMPGSFASYEWQDQSVGPTLTIAGTGLYWVKVTDANHCTATDTISIINILPVPAGFLKPSDSLCQYGKLQLSASGNYAGYHWSNGSGLSSILVDQPGQYILEVKDNKGCYGKDTVLIYSKTCRLAVFIPTSFTPNGDQLNDRFKATVFGNLTLFRLEVYNRWGEMVFYSNDPNNSWDGKIKGFNADTGVFVWRCNYQLQGGILTNEKGLLTLIR